MVLAMKSTVMSGTPRQNSMKMTLNSLTSGSFERRPSARRIPSGRETTIPTIEMTNVTIMPPHRLVATLGRPKAPLSKI